MPFLSLPDLTGFGCYPIRKFQVCDRGRALRILGCLSGASSQNLAHPTEQTGPEGESFDGHPSFGYFSWVARKVSGVRGRAPLWIMLSNNLLNNIH